MGKALIPFLVICMFMAAPFICAQSVEVSDPRPELLDNAIHISYDILNSDPTDKFIVWLSVHDEAGNEVNARALSGDIGDMVYGGNNKVIIWDLSEDQIEMEAMIYFKVHIEEIPPPEPVVVIPPDETEEKEEAVKNDQPPEPEARDNTDNAIQEGAREFNRAGIIIQSLALPGLGLSRVKGKPHWLRGVAGYGCLAGAVVMNRKAINTYEGIFWEYNSGQKDDLYQQSLSQDQTSEILAYAAVVIWVTDLIWTIAGTSDLKKVPSASYGNGLSLYSSIDPVSSAPLVGIKFRF